MAKTPLPDLILAGFGSPTALQLTVETQQFASQAGRVITLGLSERLAALLKRQGVEIAPLDGMLAGDDFATSYASIAETVLATAKEDPPALFLTQGSPLLMNTITRYLLVEARKRSLSVQTLAGVSAFDQVVAELGLDVGGTGVQVVGGKVLAESPQTVNPRVPLIVLDAAVASAGTGRSVVECLAAGLSALYPASQPVTVLNPSGSGLSRKTASLATFETLAELLQPGASLFVDVARGAPANPSPARGE
jgi:uncharacterized protein YabN with tetrapyrrole methylase and pyrophosphatase domain